MSSTVVGLWSHDSNNYFTFESNGTYVFTCISGGYVATGNYTYEPFSNIITTGTNSGGYGSIDPGSSLFLITNTAFQWYVDGSGQLGVFTRQTTSTFTYVTDNYSYIDYTGEYRIDPGNYKQLDVPIPFSDQGFTFYIKMKIDSDIADNAVVFSRHGPYYGYVPPNYYMKLQKSTNGVNLYTLSLRQNYNYNYCYADMTILPDTVTELYFYCDGNVDDSKLTCKLDGVDKTFYNNMSSNTNVYKTDTQYNESVYTYLGTEINDDDGTLVNTNFKGYIYRFYTSSFLNKNVVNPPSTIDALWGPFDLANTNTQYTISSNNYYTIDTPTDYSVSNVLVNDTGITFYIDFISPARTDPFYNGELLKIYTQDDYNYFILTVNSFDEFQFPTVLDTDTRYEILYNLRNVANVLVLTMLLMNNSNVYRSTKISDYNYTLSTNSQWYIDSVVKTNRVRLYDKLYTETQFFKPSYETYTGPSVTNELTTPIYGEYININMKRVVSFKSNTVTYNNNYVNAVYEYYGTSDSITYNKDAETFSEHRMILSKLRPMYEWGYASCDFYNDNDVTPYMHIYSNIHNQIQPILDVYSNSTVVIGGNVQYNGGNLLVNINKPGSVNVNGSEFTWTDQIITTTHFDQFYYNQDIWSRDTISYTSNNSRTEIDTHYYNDESVTILVANYIDDSIIDSTFTTSNIYDTPFPGNSDFIGTIVQVNTSNTYNTINRTMHLVDYAFDASIDDMIYYNDNIIPILYNVYTGPVPGNIPYTATFTINNHTDLNNIIDFGGDVFSKNYSPYSKFSIVVRGHINHTGDFPVNINIPGSVDVNGTVFTSNGVYNMQVTADIIPYTATFTIIGYEDLTNIIDFGGVDFYFKTYYPANFITNRIEYIPSQLNNPVATQYTSIQTYPQFNVVTTDAIPYPILNGEVYLFVNDIFTYPGYELGHGWSKLYGSDPLGQLVYDAYVIGPRTITVDTDATVFISWLDENYTPQSVQGGGSIDVNGVGLYQISISCFTDNDNSYIHLTGLESNVYAQYYNVPHTGSAYGTGRPIDYFLCTAAPQIPTQNVDYMVYTSDGDAFTGSSGNDVFTDVQSYISQYTNVYLVRLSGTTTSSNCALTCSTSAFLSVNDIDRGYSTNDEPTFIEFGDGSEIYNYVITINYDTTTQLNVSGLTSYILTNDYINYTKIPVTQYEFITNAYVINDISLPVYQHFGSSNTVITGNTFIFDNTHTFDTYSDATYGVDVQLGDGVGSPFDMTPFENRTYVSARIEVFGLATYLTLGPENIIFGPPSIELSNGIATPNFTNNGQYIINTYNGYFANLEYNINYYGNNYIFKSTITSDINPELLTYDILAFNKDVDPQHFSFILSDGSNVETNTFTKGDLITIPNFYDSNSAIANYKTTII